MPHTGSSGWLFFTAVVNTPLLGDDNNKESIRVRISNLFYNKLPPNTKLFFYRGYTILPELGLVWYYISCLYFSPSIDNWKGILYYFKPELKLIIIITLHPTAYVTR